MKSLDIASEKTPILRGKEKLIKTKISILIENRNSNDDSPILIASNIDGVDVDGIVVGDEVVAHGVVEIGHLIVTSVLDTKIQKHWYLKRT